MNICYTLSKRGMVFSGSERGVWCGALEKDKNGLGLCGF